MYIDNAEWLREKNKKGSKIKGKYVALGEGDDPYTVTLERAMELVGEKKAVDAAKTILSFEEEGIEVLNGKYGPYVTNGKKNAKIPKETEPGSLSVAACKELLESAPAKRTRRKKTPKK